MRPARSRGTPKEAVIDFLPGLGKECESGMGLRVREVESCRVGRNHTH